MGEFSLHLFGKKLIDYRSGSLENPQYSLTDPNVIDYLFGEQGGVININHDTALNYSAVWRAVTLLSGHIAFSPKHVFIKTDEGRNVATNHPVDKLIYRRPSYTMSSFIWFERLMQYLLLWGNAYAIIQRNSYYEPINLPLVKPSDVDVVEKNNGLYYKINGYSKPLPATEVIHVPGFGDGIKGKDPITVARESIEGGLIYQKTGNKFFENGYLNDRFLSLPGKLPDKNREAFLESLKKAYQGMKNAGTPMLLEGGAELKSIGMPPENMQFLQSKKHHISEIARWFGVPPHKLADLERSTNNNIEHQGIEYVTDALLPWTVRIEQEFNYKLFTEEEQENHYVKFNLNALMRGDLRTRSEYYSKATGGRPWMTPDEVRELEDTNTRGGKADELVDPANIVGNNVNPQN
jgi:HK97 family phage portal protein